MYPVHSADPGFALGCLGARSPAPMELTLLCPAGFERRLGALLSGVLGHSRATQAGDAACSGYEVFFGVLHRKNCTLVAET